MTAHTRNGLDRLVALLGAALIIATGVLFVAHDDQDGGASARQAAQPSDAVDTVPISDFLYKPATITVTIGTKLKFTNTDSAPHTATSGPSSNAAGAFDTGTLKKGQSKSVKLTKAGKFAYYCELHPFMKATVIVK